MIPVPVLDIGIPVPDIKDSISWYQEIGWLVVLRIYVALAPREDAGGLNREYALRIPSVS